MGRHQGVPPARAAEGEGALPPAGGGRRHTQMQWFCFRAAQELHIGDICALHLSQSCDAELAIQVQDDHCLCRAVVESSNWLPCGSAVCIQCGCMLLARMVKQSRAACTPGSHSSQVAKQQQVPNGYQPCIVRVFTDTWQSVQFGRLKHAVCPVTLAAKVGWLFD